MRKFKTLRSLALLAMGAWVPAAGAQSANVWLTTSDQSKRLQQQAPVTFSAAAPGTNCIVVDETQVYQEIEGFGAAFTDSTGYVLNQLASPTARTNAMRALFSRAGIGIGLSFMRLPMGGSDLARFHYSYDDLPAGQTDTNLTSFSIAHDQADIIPLINLALEHNPQMKLVASPWSPPGWMKTSGSMIGGSLLSSMYRPFANYFVRFIQAYGAHGIPIDYVTLQNEPLYVPGDYPGMSMDAATQATLLKDHFLPVFDANNLSTKILVYDHNWDRADYPETIYSDPVLRNSTRISGAAWHGYGGNVGVMLAMGNKYPGKGNYQTEHSGGTWVSDQLQADMEEIIHSMRSSCKGFIKWNLAGDQNLGPHAGGCGTCMPLVMVNNSSGAASYTIDFYTLGHFSKFVLPSARRIYSGNADGIISSAFVNADGSKALVAYNDSAASKVFSVAWGDKSFSYTLGARCAVTFSWSGAQSGKGVVRASHQVQASSFSLVNDLQTEASSDAPGGFNVGYASTGSYAVYRNMDFGAGYTNVTVCLASAGSGGTVEFRVDGATGPLLGSVSVPITGGWQTWQTVTGPVNSPAGVRDLYVVFKGGNSIGNFSWFRFSGAQRPLPAPWSTSDVGSVGATGSAWISGGEAGVSGSGSDIETTADGFRFLYQNGSENCEMRVRVTSVENTDAWAKAGILFREDLGEGSANAGVFVTPGHGMTFQRRVQSGGTTTATVLPGVTAPRWVRLVRKGSFFTAYHSADGVEWSEIGSASIVMSNRIVAGVGVTSHKNGALCRATMEGVTFNQAPGFSSGSSSNLSLSLDVIAGNRVVLTNSAVDVDMPVQAVRYSMAGAPEGAELDETSGILRWRPRIDQAGATYGFQVAAEDDGVPPMSGTRSVVIEVIRPVTPRLSPVLRTDGSFGFRLGGDSGPDYTILASTNLSDWEPVHAAASPAVPFEWTDTNRTLQARFYRAVVGP